MIDITWSSRIQNASKYKNEWETKFRCKKLYEYFEGFQWKNKENTAGADAYSFYVLNLVYSTIKIKLANLVFKRPQFMIGPNPGNMDWDEETAIASAQLKQDVLNTLINRPNANFKREIWRAARDSFFRFGVLEVGYAADWRNPLSKMPDSKNRNLELEDQTTSEDKFKSVLELPESERIYFKRIKPARFLTSTSDAEDLEGCDWCGYYQYYSTQHLLKSDNIEFPKNYMISDISNDYKGIDTGNIKEVDSDMVRAMKAKGGISKVYHIWDFISGKRLLLLDGSHILFEDTFERHPFSTIRWDERESSWYPIPPVFQWISPQDEINEAREQMRSYRRRFTRKFQAVESSIAEEEIEKFASGPDGSIIFTRQKDAITPIENPAIGATIETSLVIAKDDFNIVSGTSSEARGQADRTTATQAKIIDARSNIRESAEQIDFSDFICSVGRETLLQAQERLTSGMWIKLTADPTINPNPDESKRPVYQAVTSQVIDDGYDFQINIDVANASPTMQQDEKQKFIEFLSIVNNFPQIVMSVTLVREAAYRCGYRNEKVITEMQKAAIMAQMAQSVQAQSQGPGGPSPGGDNANNQAKGVLAQQSPNTAAQVDAQMTQQLGV